MISSYWKSVNFGDPKLQGFFNGVPMVVEEKLDGSQFSFGKISGELSARSRSKQLDLDAPESLFSRAVGYVKEVEALLPNNVVFRSEAITSNRHNTLCYSNVPPGYCVVFNAENVLTGELLNHVELIKPLGLTPAQRLAELDGKDNIETVMGKLTELLNAESQLGGPRVEGVVVKRLHSFMYYMDKPIFAKLVSQAFREKHKFAWKETNPGQGDIFEQLVEALSTDARFEKSIQHLSESGKLSNSLQDIGPLIKEVNRDILEEESEWIKEKLFQWAGKKISRAVGSRVPDWYKKKLTEDFVKMEVVE